MLGVTSALASHQRRVAHMDWCRFGLGVRFDFQSLPRERKGQAEDHQHDQPIYDPDHDTGLLPPVGAQISFPIATAVSTMRLEKPHSLSYHDKTATNVPSITFVWSI